MGIAEYVANLNNAEQSIDDLAQWVDVKHSKVVFLQSVKKAKSELQENDELVIYSVVLNGFGMIDVDFESRLKKYLSQIKEEKRYVFRSDVLMGRRTTHDVIFEWLGCNKSAEDIKSECMKLCTQLTSEYIIPTIGVLIYSGNAQRKLSPDALVDYPIEEAKKAKDENCNYRIYKVS